MAIVGVTSAHTPASSEECALAASGGDGDRTRLVRVLGVCAPVAVCGTVDQRVAQIGRRQRGQVARRQLIAAGLSGATIRRMLARHRLIPQFPGAYAVGHDAPTELGVETAALLAIREGAALSNLSAAYVWELRPRREGPVEVVVGGSSSARTAGITVHRSCCLAPRDIRMRHGLPVTSPARTLLDLADQLTARQLELAYDQAVTSAILRPSEVAELLGRAAGRRGGPLLAALIDGKRTPTVTRSTAEERLLSLIREALLPHPRVNSRLQGYEVDFHWPDESLVVEVDGFRFHSTRRAFESDRRRDRDLQALGLRTMRVTWRQLEEEPYAVIARIAQGLAAAGIQR